MLSRVKHIEMQRWESNPKPASLYVFDSTKEGESTK